VISFRTPDILTPYHINEKFPSATFDREKAIKQTDLEFLAIGHPFVDAMLDYIGSYDFGGLATSRKVRNEKLKGIKGFQFNFIEKKIIPQEIVGDEYLFSFHSIFITDDNEIREDIAEVLVNTETFGEPAVTSGFNLSEKYELIRSHMENKRDFWDWDEEVDLLNISRIEFE